MQFESFSDFLSMGGYGVYVFSVYIISSLVLLANVVFPLRARQKLVNRQEMS